MKEKVLKLMKKSTSAGIAILSIISVIFALISISSVHMIQKKTADIYELPYTVSNATKELQTNFSDMKMFIENLISQDSQIQVEQVSQFLGQKYVRPQELLNLIKERYTGPEQDVENLERALEEIYIIHDDAIEYTVIHTKKEVSNFINTKVFPKYETANKYIEVIGEFADQQVKNLENEASGMATVTIIGSAALALFIVLFSFYLRNIEKKRQMETAYRLTLFDMLSENAEVVFFIYDIINKNIEYITQNSQRLLGISESLLVEDGDAINKRLFKAPAKDILEAFESGNISSPLEREFRFKDLDGGERWMVIDVNPVTVNNKVTHFIVSLTDRTESILINKTLKEALGAARSADTAKRDFLSRMSHEIRTPMNAIIGMTAIATANSENSAKVEDCLGKIEFSSKHLLSIINDVLDMSKIEGGKISVASEPFELKKLIDSVNTIIYPQTVEKKLEFDENIIGLTEETLIGDSTRVGQILINLLSNALKFTPEGGKISLEIKQIRKQRDHIRLKFTVSDTGIGMSKAFLDKIYDPFSQEDRMSTGKYGGTGLGMSITKNLVNMMSGTIKIKSEENKGSSFIVELSFFVPKDQKEVCNEKNDSLLQLKALIADNDKESCIHTQTILAKFGIISEFVLSGKEAVDKIIAAHGTDNEYEICILDWKTPDLSGIETTEKLREALGREALIIIISAFDTSRLEETAMKAGANAVISKPVFASSLYNTLITVTEWKNSSLKNTPAENGKEVTYDFSGKKLLLVEDNELNMGIAKEILEITGVEIDVASNGKEAVEKYIVSAPGEYSVILMDIQMPVMNGYEATKEIRTAGFADSETIPIFAMTANAFGEDVSEAIASGMNGHIAKPIDIQKLFSTLKELIG